MVNSKKWEKLKSFSDIRVDDEIRTIRTLSDGSRADVRGIVRDFRTVNYIDGWYSEKDWRITTERMFRDRGEYETVEVYRKLPKPFDFPKERWALIEAQYKDSDAVTQFIFDGLQWVRANAGGSKSEQYIRTYFKNFKILTEGINK
jgi:hypothetical protein